MNIFNETTLALIQTRYPALGVEDLVLFEIRTDNELLGLDITPSKFEVNESVSFMDL